MKKIVIDNVSFDFDMGCRILKLKHKDVSELPNGFAPIVDIWDDIVPATFNDIATLTNLEARRIGILHLGIQRLTSQIKPTLISKKTLSKKTTWVNEQGELVEHKFEDTYELYMVSGDVFSEGLDSWRKMQDCYYVRCKDTSTDREYLIWVDLQSVYRTNELGEAWNFDIKKINAIQCIAWTIQTDIPNGNIEKIIRQGDCIMIKPKGKYTPLKNVRHLTEKEYKKLLVCES